MPYLSHFSEETTVLGPGKRFAIWFQGCKKRCPGCIDPAGREIGKGAFVTVADLLKMMKRQDSLTGVTISGGEPFLQAEELTALVEEIKRETHLDIMLYSGYSLAELLPQYGLEFFQFIDIFIDGEYVEELNHDTLYRGSDNQQIYFFTEKYRPFAEKIRHSKNRSIQFEFNQDNELYLIGLPPKGFYEKLLAQIAKKGMKHYESKKSRRR
jgi:anaerobic ribonucleoside-triphosphate reductase activating protein